MIVIGACIGSGIFVTPASTMQVLPHHGYAILTWLAGGLVTFLGAMTFSELGSRFPQEGGVYVYLKQAYGAPAGFLYGWIILLIVNTGALAALGMAFADYLTFFLPVSDSMKSVVAIFTIWGLTLLNITGVHISQGFASLFTGAKLLAMAAIIAVGLWHIPNVTHEIILNPSGSIPVNLFGGMMMAFIGVFWSMGGWHHATYLSGEAVNAQKTIPRAMLAGTLTVTLIYILVLIAYMVLLPLQAMADSPRIAGDAISVVFQNGGKMVAVAITISIFGTIGIYTMTAPRIYYAMARDGIFFRQLADISSRFQTPYKAMLFQSVWATVLIIAWGSFLKIITFVTFMDIVFMALATASVFIFRKRQTEHPGYTLKGYPWIPLGFLIITSSFVVYTLSSLNAESLAGMAILLSGVPAYYYFSRKNRSKHSL